MAYQSFASERLSQLESSNGSLRPVSELTDEELTVLRRLNRGNERLVRVLGAAHITAGIILIGLCASNLATSQYDGFQGGVGFALQPAYEIVPALESGWRIFVLHDFHVVPPINAMTVPALQSDRKLFGVLVAILMNLAGLLILEGWGLCRLFGWARRLEAWGMTGIAVLALWHAFVLAEMYRIEMAVLVLIVGLALAVPLALTMRSPALKSLFTARYRTVVARAPRLPKERPNPGKLALTGALMLGASAGILVLMAYGPLVELVDLVIWNVPSSGPARGAIPPILPPSARSLP
jgi:hypothetical protein